MDTFTLFDLNEYLKRVIALNFPEPVWISCEISQCKNSRGNYYLDLIQQNEKEEIIAQSSAVIWYKNFLFIKSKLGDLLPSLLVEGVEIKVKVTVEYNERYGLKLVVEDLDPSFTLGQMELNKQKILERLKMEGVIHKNKALPYPLVVQNIAVISSETAAGYRDFQVHMEENSFGYQFHIELFAAAMQGQNTDKEVLSALDKIKNSKRKYDVVIIIRGGGSKLDLAAFDNFNIGYKIATFEIPVLTGIGHEIDQSIADITAHLSLKTPTAVADHIISTNMNFESKLIELNQNIATLSGFHLKNATLSLESLIVFLKTKPYEVLRHCRSNIDQRWLQILSYREFIVKSHVQQLKSIESQVKVSDPKLIMKRGFTLVRKGDDYITSKKEMIVNKKASLEFFDGTVDIVVDG